MVGYIGIIKTEEGMIIMSWKISKDNMVAYLDSRILLQVLFHTREIPLD